jgi:hypothetical protein
MIVKILSGGKSFSGLSNYLTHDPEAETKDRVAWTHTHNLANDHVPSAVNEMLWTARNAELLKQEAGVRAGGRATENPVKHLSLNWSPEDNPTREHMVETTEKFLEHMKWQQHQAIVVAHDDKAYAHVHVMLNVVHPETGLRLDDGFERRRAQAWALEYEREQGRVHCKQRLKNAGERDDAPTRPAWLAFQENQMAFEREEKSRRDLAINSADGTEKSKIANFSEWKLLKGIQRHEREQFFADGKSAFSELRLSIYREVREEYRERWADYYAARDGGADQTTLASLKAELVADQKAVLEGRRDEACKELRESRDGLYRQLLDNQRDVGLDLRARQEAGVDNTAYLEALQGRNSNEDAGAAFHEAAEATTRWNGEERHEDFAASSETPETGRSAGDSFARVEQEVGVGVGLRLCSAFDSFLTIFEGPPPDRRLSQADRTLLEATAEATSKREQHQRDEADEEWRERQRSPCE